MKPDHRLPVSSPSGTHAGRGFEKVILRLVKGGPERLAIEAGEIDAIVDPASGTAILLPEAQRALIERKTRFRSLVGLASDWYWEQDEQYRFVSRAGATVDGSGFGDEAIIGKALWELAIDNMSETDWQTHRRQLEWRATFRDLEVRCVERAGEVRYLSISGEPVFDGSDRFKGYHGITRDITERRLTDAVVREPSYFARATLDALASHVAVLDAAGTVLLANRAWRVFAGTHSGIGAGVFEGANYLAACDDAGGNERVDGVAIAAGVRQVIAGERELFRYDYVSDLPSGRCWFMLGITGVAGDTAARAVVAREDITERKRGELLLVLEYAVARSLADAGTAAAALQAVIRAVCETQGWDCGRYFRLDEAAGVLCFNESWGVPGAAVEQFLERSRGMVFRPGAGLTGRVFQSGQPLWVLDGGRTARVSSAALAPETGGEGAFVFPVMSGEKTTGVLAFSSRSICEPDDRMLQTVRSIGGQLGRFLRQQQAADALRRSEARFRRLTELSSDWYWEQDSEYRFTRFVGSGVLGAGEVLGKTRWELPNIVLGDAQWAEHKSQLAAQWSFCDFEFAAIHPDGELGYYCISGEPVYDEAGAFTGYCGTGLDITGRKRAEIALRESEARLRALAASSSD